MTYDRMALLAREAGVCDADSKAARFLFGRVGLQHSMGYISSIKGNPFGVPTSMRSAWTLMNLDRDFQSSIMVAIGTFELQLRTRYATEMSSRYGAFAHRNKKLYKDEAMYDKFIAEYRKVLKACGERKNSAQADAISKYSDMPIWMAVEEMPLGMVSKLYKNTKSKAVRDEVAESFGTDKSMLGSWMNSITFVRNRCAHHGQLLGIRLPVMPKKMEYVEADNGNPFYIALILMRLTRSNANLGDLSFIPPVRMFAELSAKLPRYGVFLKVAGIPEDWMELIGSPDVSGIDMVFYHEKPTEVESRRVNPGRLPMKDS